MRESDPLPPEFADAFDRVRPALGRLAGRVLFYKTIGSTNDVAAALAAETDGPGAVVIADAQTAGRGRRGHTWFSPPGSGLYVSVVLAPSREADGARATALLTLMAGVALADAVQAATGLAVDIKWPNDLLIGRRKLAGILAEGVTAVAASARSAADDGFRVILGFGINVSASAYPPELRDRVASLEGELGRPVDRGEVCAASLVALARRYEGLRAGQFDAILDDWRRRAPGSRGARVRWDGPDGPRTGVTAGIDDSGALLVRHGDAIQRLVAGEVFWD